MDLNLYLQDGAHYQARAVLAYLQGIYSTGIDASWNHETKSYDANVQIGRWENCREQGYVISMCNPRYEQINIAFFEHRNSDAICAISWLQKSINSLNIDNAEFGNIYKDKWDISHSVGYGEALKMAEWIMDQLMDHWME